MKDDETVREAILKLLEREPSRWYKVHELVKVRVGEKWLGQSADRIAREMAREGLIERVGRAEGQFYASYRAKQGQLAMSF